MATRTMRSKERSIFKIHPSLAWGEVGNPPKVGPNEEITLDITNKLIREKGDEPPIYTPELRIVNAAECRKKGNEAFKKKNFEEAKKQWEKGEKLISHFTLEKDQKLRNPSVEITFAIWLNLGNIAIQTQDWEYGRDKLNRIIRLTDEVPKAFFYRGVVS